MYVIHALNMYRYKQLPNYIHVTKPSYISIVYRHTNVHTYIHTIHIHSLINTTRGQILRSEFVQEPVMRSLNTEYGWAAIMCATGPSLLTASVREHCLLNNIDNQVCIPVCTYVCTNACKRCLTHIELYVTTSLCMAVCK